MVKINLSNLRGDFTDGLTAGIVALPLALALGVASGLGPMAGLYGAIAVGFFAALFGGTPAQISGPTGPMVVVLVGLFASLSGDASLIFTAVILARYIPNRFWGFRCRPIHQVGAIPGYLWFYVRHWRHHHYSADRAPIGA